MKFGQCFKARIFCFPHGTPGFLRMHAGEHSRSGQNAGREVRRSGVLVSHRTVCCLQNMHWECWLISIWAGRMEEDREEWVRAFQEQ